MSKEITDQPRLQALLRAIDEANRDDPLTVAADGKDWPKEEIYGLRMSQCLDEFKNSPDEVLQIACRAQHIQRWKIPRSDYPTGKAGYYRWRTELGKFHAETTAALMQNHGYSEDEIEQTKSILRKQNLKSDANSQAMEDVACLVFLRFYFDDFANDYSDEKVISIVQKTWAKMSERGQQAALQLPLSEQGLALVQRALGQ